MKEESIEICTKNCASLHSLMCMRRKTEKFEPLKRNWPGRFFLFFLLGNPFEK